MWLSFLNEVIVLHFNDTIVNSSETIINIINKKYNTNKTYKDLKDKKFRSIYKNITSEEIEEIRNSKEYLENLKFNTSFIEIYNKYNDRFTFVVDSENVNDKEKEYIENTIPIIVCNQKNIPQIKKYITIDEDSKNLSESCSKIRILISNQKPWNKMIYNQELYEVRDWNDVNEILDYICLKGW